MIRQNRNSLERGVAHMIETLREVQRDIAKQNAALDVVPNVTTQQNDAMVSQLSVAKYVHYDAEIRRIFAATQETELQVYGD